MIVNVGPNRDLKTPFHAALMLETSTQVLGDVDVVCDPASYDQIIYADTKGNTSLFPVTGYSPVASAGSFGTRRPRTRLVGQAGTVLSAAYVPGSTYPLMFPTYWPTGNHRPFTGIYGKGGVVLLGDDCETDGIEISGYRNASGNGAGIRFQGKNPSMQNCFSHDNEMNFQTSPQPVGTGQRTFLKFVNNRSSHGGTRDPSKNWGQSHNAYLHEADEIFVKDFTSWDVGGAGLLLKLVSGGGRQFIINNSLTESDSAKGSYELDLSSGPAVVAGNRISKGVGDPKIQNQGKISQYATGRSPTLEDGNWFYGFGNVFQCFLQKRVSSFDIRNYDGPDPDLLTEKIGGDIFKNVVVYRPNPKNYDASYKPYALPNDPNVTVKIHDSNRTVAEGGAVPELLTMAQRAALAALTFETLDVFYEQVRSGAFA